MGSGEQAEALVVRGRELVVAHCRLTFETGVGKAKQELFQASFNISRVLGLGKPEREIERLLEELQKGLRMLALISSVAAKQQMDAPLTMQTG